MIHWKSPRCGPACWDEIKAFEAEWKQQHENLLAIYHVELARRQKEELTDYLLAALIRDMVVQTDIADRIARAALSTTDEVTRRDLREILSIARDLLEKMARDCQLMSDEG